MKLQMSPTHGALPRSMPIPPMDLEIAVLQQTVRSWCMLLEENQVSWKGTEC